MIPPNWKSRPGIISMMLFSKETFGTLMRKSVDLVQNLKDPSMSFVFQAKNLKDPIMSVAISDQVRRHDLWNWHLEARATWPWTNCLSACVVHASHDTCHDYLVIFWGKSPARLQNAHGREKSVYQHAWFTIYWTRVMATGLLSGSCHRRVRKMSHVCEQDVYKIVVWCVARFEKLVVEPSCQCSRVNLGYDNSS